MRVSLRLMAIDSPPTPDLIPSPTSDTATSPRAGGPPRWLVVVLVVAVLVGIGLQTRPDAKPRIDPPESQPLGIEHALQLTSVWPNSHSLLFAEHSLAHDPATDHFWIVARNHFNMQQQLEVAASLDGGQTLQPPVDVMPLLPSMSDIQSAIAYGPGRALYLAVVGMAGKQGQQVGILRSTDEGTTWSLWWHRPNDGYRLDNYGARLLPWNDQLVLLYSAQKSGVSSGIFAEILQADGRAAKPQLIAADPPGDERDIQHVFVTPDALLLLAMHGGGSGPRRATLCGLSAAGGVLPIQEIPVKQGHKLVDAALLGDADGDPVVLVKLDAPPPAILALLSRQHHYRQISDPRKPTLRYHWDSGRGAWNLTQELAGPPLFTFMRTPDNRLLMSILARHNSTDQGYFIDALAADSHWDARWELLNPPSAQYLIQAGIQLNDSRLVLLGTEAPQPAGARRDVLVITEPLLGVDATKASQGSPSKTP